MKILKSKFDVKSLAPAVLIFIFIVIPILMEIGVLPENKYFFTIMCFICSYSIVTSGLDILFGYSGQMSMGHAGFFAIGAYGTVLLSHPGYGLSQWAGFSLPPAITIFLAAFVATGFGILLSIPASKLVFHFLSLLTIAFGYSIYMALVSFAPITNGLLGITRVPPIQFFGFSFSTVLSKFRFLILVAVFLFFLLIIKARIIDSRMGRALIAIRENTAAAGSCGINTPRYKTMAFAISAFYTGFAGALYAHLLGFVSPDTFVHNTSIIMFTMLLFGGSGSLYGPIIGAAAITLIQEGLQDLEGYRMLIYGVFLLIIVLFLPNGIYGLFNFFGKKAKKEPRTIKEESGDVES